MLENQPLLFCNYPLIFNKFITILFVQQIDLVWRSQPQNLMLKILVVYRCFYKLIFPIYYCCPIGLKKHSFADETCSAGFYPGDPFCNDENNNAECNYDNGACCDHWTLVGYSWTLWDYFCTVRNHLISILFWKSTGVISEKKIISIFHLCLLGLWMSWPKRCKDCRTIPDWG